MAKGKPVVRILLADNHTIFREGLKALLSGQPDTRVVGETGDGAEVTRLVERLKPDVLLLDRLLPRMNARETLRSVAKTSCRAVLLCGEIDADEVSRIIERGARGFVMKDSAVAVLLKCIRAVTAGQYWMGREGAANLADAVKLNGQRAKTAQSKNYGLTPREMEVVKAVVTGCSNKQIAAQYKISEQTVKHHMTNIFDKLGVYNRLELTLFAFHHNLVEK
jgi:DNA-binding NarL/FixJ family response regulator